MKKIEVDFDEAETAFEAVIKAEPSNHGQDCRAGELSAMKSAPLTNRLMEKQIGFLVNGSQWLRNALH